MILRTSRRTLFLLTAALSVLSLVALAQSGDKENKENKDAATTKLRVEVTGGEKPAPVANASVYVKYQKERALAKDQMIEMNLKTNREGVARVSSLPHGKVLIQVIAPCWKTFGAWYDLSQEEQTIKIKLQKPPRWY